MALCNRTLREGGGHDVNPILGIGLHILPPHDSVLMAVILILIFLIEFRGGKEESNERSDLAATRVLSVSGPMMHPAPAPNREID